MSISFSTTQTRQLARAVALSIACSPEDDESSWATLAIRAWNRFEAEFEFYKRNGKGLSEVRMYHRLLIQVLREEPEQGL